MTTTSWYRSTYWGMKGNKEYCRSGYEAASARFNPDDIEEDCTSRHIMITGANKGLGQQTAHELAKRGAVLHLVCRNMDDAKATRATIVSETGNDKIHLYSLDLSRPRDVVQFCAQFRASHDKLHVLINNAGVMRHERVVDEDGLEYNFAVNTLAMHLLVVGLMPLLENCEDSRVVTVSSAGMLTVKLDPLDLSFAAMEPFNGRLAYSQTKRQQVVLTLCYAQNFSKVHFSCMHPGWVDTQAVRTSLPEFYETYKDKLRTVAQGADTIVWLAASRRATSHSSGLFFQDREPVSTHLPLAWTRTSVAEEKLLLEKLQEIIERVNQPRSEQTAAENQQPQGLEKNGIVTESPIANNDLKESCPKDLDEQNRQIEPAEELSDAVTSEPLSQATEVPRQADVDASNSEITVKEPLESREESDVNFLEADNKDTSLTSSATDQSATDSGVGVSPEPITELDEEKSHAAEDEVVSKNSDQEAALTAITTNLEAAKIDESVKESTVS